MAKKKVQDRDDGNSYKDVAGVDATEYLGKPYVAYRISGEGGDKGLGYSVKKSIRPFLDKHHLSGTPQLVQAASDSFEIVLTLYYNGNADFNVRAFMDHLNTTGQVPDKARPSIRIVPIPRDESINVITESPEQKSIQTTIDTLQAKIRKEEEHSSGLTKLLSKVQKDSDDKTRRLGELEKELEGATPKQYDHPILPVLAGYALRGRAIVVDASTDFDAIVQEKDESVFVSLAGKSDVGYIDYVNAKTGMEFKDEKGFEEWKAYIEKNDSWESCPSGKQYTEQKSKLESDEKALKMLAESGASSEIIESVKKIVGERIKAVEALETSAQSEKSEFERAKQIYENLGDLKSSYDTFALVKESSEDRRRADSRLPIVASLFQSSQDVRIYIPSSDLETHLEKHIVSRVGEIFSDSYDVKTSAYDSNFAVIEISPKQSSSRRDLVRLSRSLTSRISDIKQDPVLNSLGIAPEIMSIAEF